MAIATYEVTFPDGKVRKVNMLRLLVQVQNCEFKVKHDMFLPGVNKLHPTVKALRDEYGLAPSVKTWADAAEIMRAIYDDLSSQLNAGSGKDAGSPNS